ncbi:MAG TPA: hypothetical protein VF170_09555 [Planctomycetaceae bacterium]
MTTLRRLLPPLLAMLVLAAIVVSVSACGYESTETDVVEGEPVKLGDLHYNVIFSRYLNPNDTEDSAYLVGQAPPEPETTYFGVFFEVQNETEESKPLPDKFTIEDSDHEVFESLASDSLFAFPMGGELEEHEQIPVLDSPPEQGPIEGSVVLFLLPDDASQNRPLVLEIHSPDGETGEVTLDL